MKKITGILLLGGIVLSSWGQTPSAAVSIIPQPVSVVTGHGHFILPKTIVLEVPDVPELKQTTLFLEKRLSASTGYPVRIVRNETGAVIRLVLNKQADAGIGKEGYVLSIKPEAVVIRANQPAGLFYGVQTFLLLMPKEIESPQAVRNISWQAPCLEIRDYPRFAWRGLMFDVSRHFFTKKQVEDFIDDMVRYKFNVLHLHLTDDEGWRIQIKSLPRLTEVGAWNVRKVGTFGNFSAPGPDEPRDYGGFYTQEDIRDLVQYAKDRFVNILPEVDVPGHSLAAIASYPDLSCTPGSDKYQVRSGESIMNWHDHGFTALVDNTLCPANDKVYDFLDKVFTEISSLFPFEYIHVGGDDCAKNFWEKSDAIRQLMNKEGLKNMQEVQSYFEKRVEKIIESKGKRLIGWDEILEGGLAPNAAVMSWRGMQGGIEAARQGHDVVMTPTTYVYLDYMQSDRMIEPPVYATLRLKTAYQFDPLPDSVNPKLILGGQANLWTEQVYNTRHLQYMVWPRSLAVAECLWTPKEKKNWNDFSGRVETAFGRMDIEQIKYARSMFDPIITVKRDARDSLLVELSSEVEGLDIFYSFDNSNPDNFYPRYSSPLSVPKDASMLKVITYRNGQPVGKQIDIPVSELHRRAGLKED